MKFYAGVDGGGSKTAILAVREDTAVIKRTQLGSASWNEYGIAPVVEGIHEALTALLPEGGQLGGVVLGMPCFGESAEGDRQLTEGVQAVFADIPAMITNDVHLGWAGSMALAAGINIVAGTGSMAFGVDETGTIARSGGWDAFYSDEGSGYWLGRKTMELFTKQADGRMPKSALYDIICAEFALENDMQFIDYVKAHYLQNRKQIGSMQMLALKAAEAGDESAIALYQSAAKELALMIVAVKNQLQPPKDGWRVSYSGGVFRVGDYLMRPLAKELAAAEMALEPPQLGPAEGAVLMAFQKYCPNRLAALAQALKEAKA